MSRLFDALSNAKSERSILGVRSQELHLSDAVPIEIRKAAEPPRNIAPPKIDADEETLAVDEARRISVQASSALRLVSWSDPNGLGAENFRALVTRLDHMRKQTKLKSLQVTSSVSNEGKTLVAANLAVTLAKYSGARTLLVEGDLHKPTLASLFGVGNLQGVGDWWSDWEHEVPHFLHRFEGMPLWFFAAGTAHEQPAEILRSARLAAAFEQLASSFDWIVVDSTPMQPVIDANLWSRLVDGTLLVVREGVTPLKTLKKGLQSLDHPKLIGTVINGVSQDDYKGYKGYSGGSSR